MRPLAFPATVLLWPFTTLKLEPQYKVFLVPTTRLPQLALGVVLSEEVEVEEAEVEEEEEVEVEEVVWEGEEGEGEGAAWTLEGKVCGLGVWVYGSEQYGSGLYGSGLQAGEGVVGCSQAGTGAGVKAGVDPWFWVGTLFWVVSCLGVWFLDLVLLCPSLLLLKLSRESLPSLSLLLLGLHPLTGLGPQLLLQLQQQP